MKNKKEISIILLSLVFLATNTYAQNKKLKSPKPQPVQNDLILEKLDSKNALVSRNLMEEKGAQAGSAKKERRQVVTYAKDSEAIIEVLTVPHQKPQLTVELDDTVIIDGRAGKIGFPGRCLYADEVEVNGTTFRVNPVTNKFYALIKLKDDAQLIIRCEAKNEFGSVVTTKTLIRR